jgi:hypothetical protein
MNCKTSSLKIKKDSKSKDPVIYRVINQHSGITQKSFVIKQENTDKILSFSTSDLFYNDLLENLVQRHSRYCLFCCM